MALILIAGARGAASLEDGSGTVDLTGLPTSASPDTTAYAALNVSAMASGTVFDDPVTGIRTVKVTSSTVPASALFVNQYATLGLQISLAWGAGSDQYTLWFLTTSGSAWLVDYQLGGAVSNFRAGPGSEGRIAFARTTGNERILYVTSGTQIRRYNTQTNAYADTGLFPYSWTTGIWLQLNHDDTWATSLNSGSTGVTALNLSTSAVISQTISGLDEIYSGYDAFAFVNATTAQVWNLAANTLATPSLGGLQHGHMSSMRGFWTIIDTDTGGGILPVRRINDDASVSSPFNITGYWGAWHTTGHWQQAAGNAQYFLMSNYSNDGVWTASMRYGLIFIRTDDGSKRVLGHHYSDSPATTTDDYWSSPRATQSHDGKLVMFTSNMLDGPRLDVFLMEVPRA